MTAYNREQYIGKAIQSVIDSTYENFELIIVDDCSKDNTVNIANAFAAKDSRIKVFVNEHNLGDYPNRNKAASYASGKYLKYVDSDDCIYPETLHIMVTLMEQFKVAGCGISMYEHSGEQDYPVYLTSKEAYEYHYFKKPIFFASPGLAIFTKKAFDSVDGFSPRRMTSDFEMWHKISLRFPIILMPADLVWIREHPRQEMADHDKYVVEYEQIKLNYLNHKDCPLTAQQVHAIKTQRRNTALKIFLRKLMQFDLKGAKPRFRVFRFYLSNYFLSRSKAI